MARKELDFYETPPWMTLALLRRMRPTLPAWLLRTAIEPCAGDGAIANVLKDHDWSVQSNDLDRARRSVYWHLDATAADTWSQFEGTQWVITNPPFGEATAIVRHALVKATAGVAFLMRLSFGEPTKDRGPLLRDYPPTKIIVLPRHSFTGDGSTDSVTTAWWIWCANPDYVMGPPIDVATKGERDMLIREWDAWSVAAKAAAAPRALDEVLEREGIRHGSACSGNR